MDKINVFISSVQSEFAKERNELREYILSDSLLGLFFTPFLFEQLPAVDKTANQVFLKEVESCDIYIGILGKEYGFEDADGVSPTEREFDSATKNHKPRFIFVKKTKQQQPKQALFIDKVQHVLVRKSFNQISELKVAVYASLINYLLDKEIVRTAPFDATTNLNASIEDIDAEKVRGFIRLAKLKRGFVLDESTSPTTLLTHLNLMDEKGIKNAALLLFGKNPQRFFITSEIRCAYFQGTEVQKPIQSYKVFKGNVFELVDQALDFVLQKLDYRIETRREHVQIPGSYEIPKEIITEAIVNAVAHRDYTSNGSVQVMMFRDRVEVWNPGSLPYGWTTDNLKKLHNSLPSNPLLAEPMYLAAYIERLGTGTTDMLKFAKKANLREPVFIQEEMFRTVVYRKQHIKLHDQKTTRKTTQKTIQKTTQKVLGIISKDPYVSRREIAELIGSITEAGIKYQLNKLKKDGIIKRVGPDRGGYWEIIKNKN